jgi:hypothetical protein
MVLNTQMSNNNMDNKQEYIICAAIKRIEENPCFKVLRPRDIYEVELGMSHADILHRFEGVVSKSSNAQGFFTSHRRWVNRKEAMEIAKACGQMPETNDISNTTLFSEMLY